MSNPIRTLAWGHFRNGRIPSSAMYVERGERFEPTAGHYLDELERAFAKVWGYPAIILEGYRSLARQRALYAGWVAGTGDLAALPGTSNHGWGRAADFASHINVYGTPQKDWMNAHAPAYGWHPAGDDFRPREAWHFEYWSGTATASLTAKPISSKEEDGMGFYIGLRDASKAKYWFSQVSGTKRAIPVSEWKFLRAQETVTNGVPIVYVSVSQQFLDSIPNV